MSSCNCIGPIGNCPCMRRSPVSGPSRKLNDAEWQDFLTQADVTEVVLTAISPEMAQQVEYSENISAYDRLDTVFRGWAVLTMFERDLEAYRQRNSEI